MEERETGKRRRREEEAEAAIAIAPKKRVEGGNILFTDDKDITFVEKRILSRDTQRRKTSGVIKNVQWSDFPMDLLTLVAGHLTPADHVRMSTTCKSWQCAALSFLFSKTPVLLFIENHTSNFFDPLSKKKWVAYIPELLDATFHYSKGGWLLLSQNNNQSRFFFFNPFTNEKINLPDFYPDTLYEPPYKALCKPGAFVVTFSSPPTSQDCIIFHLSAMTYHSPHTHKTHYFYVYHACSQKDTTWKWELKNETDEYSDLFIDLFQTQPACYKNPLYFHGSFYYLNTRGTLFIIKLTKKTTMTRMVEKPRQLPPSRKLHDCYLVESQGEILSIFCYGDETKVFQVDHNVVYESQHEDKWIELESLRDNLLFLDRLLSLSTVVRGSKMIYFPTFQRGCNDLEEPARRIWVDPNFVLKIK